MTIHIAIVETLVYNIPAYHAKCLACGWKCPHLPHSSIRTAQRHASAHVCKEVAE